MGGHIPPRPKATGQGDAMGVAETLKRTTAAAAAAAAAALPAVETAAADPRPAEVLGIVQRWLANAESVTVEDLEAANGEVWNAVIWNAPSFPAAHRAAVAVAFAAETALAAAQAADAENESIAMEELTRWAFTLGSYRWYGVPY